jgi:lipoprotein-anchoring transpeptidase ErfK/SrfK
VFAFRRARSLYLALALVGACKRGDPSADGGAPVASASAEAANPSPQQAADKTPVAIEGPVLGVIVGQANVLAEPRAEARRIGYLRLGAVVARDEQPAGKAGCPGGWYRIKPKGFVCAGDEATLDPQHPVVRAASIVRPDRASAMPYRYGFVRAVLPLYLKAVDKEEQIKAEFKLKEHLAKFDPQADELNKVVLGAYDVPVDARGVPILGKKVGDIPKPSTTWTQGELFGGSGDSDPIPWWLQGSRKIPNLADFKVPEYATFADRARRHTGLSFVGSFAMGPEAFNRRFGITTDLRLAPTSKIKPDTGSPWHGIELGEQAKAPPMPFAWIRTTEAKGYKLVDNKAKDKGELEKRSIVLLTGKKVSGPDDFYWELKNGLYVKASQAGVVREPAEWPEVAKKGGKWIEVSIENQTLILWEGQKPVYATMVSTGQDGMKDPKTTKSTVRGVFNIRSKHVTATMDSNEGSSAGGKRASSGRRSEERERSGSDDPPKKKGSKAEKGDAERGGKKNAKSVAVDKDDDAKRDRDPEYGVTKRRGEGTFWLRDVPYVEYFESGYALHVAYWHDVFGIARSHGCINVSPVDGRFIFGWTDPQIPEGWHGAMSGPEFGEGTVVIVHE